MSCYESLRTELALNLCNIIPDADLLNRVLSAVDLSMQNYQIERKPVDIVPVTGMPEVVRYYLASKAIANLSKGTIRQYGYKLSNFFAAVAKPYMDVTANDIRCYLYKYRVDHNASDSYLDNIRITLCSFFQWLTDNDYIPRNPCAKVEKVKYQQKRREALSSLSLETVRYGCQTPIEKALIDFLYSTGCRVSECAGVLLSDIDWDNNSVLIRHGKGDKQRTVYFNDEAKVSLLEYLKPRKFKSDALFSCIRSPHRPLSAHTIEQIVKAVGERTGLHVYPHKLRHTFATIGLRNGIPLDEMQALLGHSDPKTTMLYTDQDHSNIQIQHRKAFS